MLAVFRCSETLIEEIAAGRQTKICLDSQASLTTVEKSELTLDWGSEYKRALKHFAKKNNVTPVWVSGYTGIKTNKKVDQTAGEKQHSNRIHLGTNTCFPAGESHPGLHIQER